MADPKPTPDAKPAHPEPSKATAPRPRGVRVHDDGGPALHIQAHLPGHAGYVDIVSAGIDPDRAAEQAVEAVEFLTREHGVPFAIRNDGEVVEE